MNNKGFAFIETIITIVILLSGLVFIYSIYSKSLNKEKNILYYDDISYVYKTNAIKDALQKDIDEIKFKNAINNVDMYIYLFNVESNIYNSNKDNIISAYELLNFTELVYLDLDNLNILKLCLNGENNSEKCNKTKKMIEAYGTNELTEYLKKLNIVKYNDHDEIIISLFYESKNGSEIIDEGKYNNCILKNALNYYYHKDIDTASEDEKKDALKKYNKDDNISFNMYCENAYYISWVYL